MECKDCISYAICRSKLCEEITQQVLYYTFFEDDPFDTYILDIQSDVIQELHLLFLYEICDYFPYENDSDAFEVFNLNKFLTDEINKVLDEYKKDPEINQSRYITHDM